MSSETVIKLKELCILYEVAREFDYIPMGEEIERVREFDPKVTRDMLVSQEGNSPSSIMEELFYEIRKLK